MSNVTGVPDTSTRRYQEIIEKVFLDRFTSGATAVPFERAELTEAAKTLGHAVPKNLGDVVYSFRYRRELPESITSRAPSGREWAIFPAGMSVYCFRLVAVNVIEPRPGLRRTKIPDATPGVISRYAMSDEQALLAGVRYNRLLDIFTGVTCYSLRTSIEVVNPLSGSPEKAQVTNSTSASTATERTTSSPSKPREATTASTRSRVLLDGSIALFQFDKSADEITISRECHYNLVPQTELTDEELAIYGRIAQTAAGEADT